MAVLLTAVLVAAGGMSGDGEQHRLLIEIPDAVNVIAGQPVRSAGVSVGEVESLEPIQDGRAARVTLRMADGVWPVTRGAKMRLRWGGTIAYADRYIEFRPGPPAAAPIPEGGTFPASDFIIPVEFDALLRTFERPVRRDLKAMFDSAGAAFREAERPLQETLGSAPAALQETSAVLEDFEAESARLDMLVRSTDSVVSAMQRADPGMGRLVSAAATTFEAAASQADEMRAAIRAAPRTLAATRETLARSDHTLAAVGELTDRMARGVVEMRALALPLAHVLRSVMDVGPDARSAVLTARRAAPSLNPLLRRMTELMPQFGSVSRQSAGQLRCIRPYAPDIAAFFSTWGDRHNNTDGTDRYGRSVFMSPPWSNAETGTPAEFAANNPNLTYAYPTPPGMNANQPWFLPECSVGREILDPRADPEARAFTPISRMPGHGRPEERP